jgi:hypothetical protein
MLSALQHNKTHHTEKEELEAEITFLTRRRAALWYAQDLSERHAPEEEKSSEEDS